MTADFRALCAELIEAVLSDDSHVDCIDIARRARAALTEPDGPAVQSREPASVVEQPSDEELLELMPQQMRDDLAAAARALAGFDPDNIRVASAFRIILNRHIADHAHAVLARWGHPAPQPVPVSERLPELIEQALIKAECALSDIAEGEAEDSEGDPLEWAEQRAAKALSRIRPVMRQHQIQTSEWPPLPAHALPLPSND